ncbi:type II toxin-antitoxin system Phd/YefM family antitoxin [Halomonas sp. SSL-5]|uniref:type II toxin-antitoxin system Phd/YefM family antitoxin n=1 Tax=Halomonas sp. SSL-5 TaxID=3065855 RepID=UPI00273939EF|nr:type II toxin-antitoxin system Phd/YefM family antitoxin [Halomonas sp. SSL-5]MDY7116753.1 type II toxin-antitoxin system Phd/YefM family antitoxin [Halomonas sp. SSL-5]
MKEISISELHDHLEAILDDLEEPLMITRDAGEPAVLFSYQGFKSLEETLYLMASPRNAQRLDEAIAEVSHPPADPER